MKRAGWFDPISGRRTQAVGELKANPFGLYDVHGNVWEWVQNDWEPTYEGQLVAINPHNSFSAGSQRVLRGGPWNDQALTCRAASRDARDATGRTIHAGFRVSLNVDAVRTALAKSPKTAQPAISSGATTGQEWSGNGLGMKFCWCPPGSFKMGERPNQVDVKLTRGFWLGKYEVTQTEYQQVMSDNPSHFSAAGPGKDLVVGLDTDRFPVEQVSWDKATEFCRVLSEQEQRAGRLPAGWEYRLPTEAQWEYGCRAGTQTAYRFGDVESRLADHAWYDANSEKRTHEIGQKQKNVWGLHDMHGNVWEWCRDWHQEKLLGGTDPEVIEAASDRVLRGGGWGDVDGRYRSMSRSRRTPVVRDRTCGLRLAAVQID